MRRRLSEFKDLECRTDLGEDFKQVLLAKFDKVHRLIKGGNSEEMARKSQMFNGRDATNVSRDDSPSGSNS